MEVNLPVVTEALEVRATGFDALLELAGPLCGDHEMPARVLVPRIQLDDPV